MSDLKTKVFVKGDKTSEVTTVNLLFQNGKKFSIPIVHCIYVEMDDGMHIISGWSHDIFCVPRSIKMIRFWHDILGKKAFVIDLETQDRKEIKVSSELLNLFLETHEVTLDELNFVHYDSDDMMLFQSEKKREPEKTAPKNELTLSL